MKHVFISVYNKDGITNFANGLENLGYKIISTGGTFAALRDAGISNLISVEEHTGSPEMMGGLVKSLHPKIHGGILADREDLSHISELKHHNIELIDIVVNNLYPFQDNPSIENIDIGGPSMLRAAAKNYKYVTVLTDPTDYELILSELKNGGTTIETRRNLAAKAFKLTAHFDMCVSNFLKYKHITQFKYGENPHQTADFYADPTDTTGIANYTQLLGGALSFNNINDANGAVELLREFSEPAAVACKHTNPCGVGTGQTLAEAFAKALAADPSSIYGGVIALNREVNAETAAQMKGILLDIIIAPSFTREALEYFAKKKGTRVLELPGIKLERKNRGDFKRVAGGIITQSDDDVLFPENKAITDLKVVTNRKPSDTEYTDLLFAWKIVKHVKSNAVVIAKNGQSIGIGCGQVNRSWATRQAIDHATEILGADALKGAVLASDAFFPFDDSIQTAAKAGATAVIQPGGSIRDADSIQACNNNDMAMIFTEMRHFKH